SVPWSRSWSSDLSMNWMAEVRFGPITAFRAASIRMNAGAPMSSGVPFPQDSPAEQSIASTGAQMRSLEPSKSPACAGIDVRAIPRAHDRHASTRMGASASLDRVAARFHARGEGPVVGVDGLLLLGFSILLLRGAILARAPAASHRPHDGPGPGP